MKELKAVLTDVRITAARVELFEVLQHAKTPLSTAEIQKACRASDRASVYRNLELFIARGLVTIIPIGWKKRYELADPFKPHHHHLQCTECGKLVDINTPQLETLIDSVAQQQDFVLSSHHIELAGLCSNCRKK